MWKSNKLNENSCSNEWNVNGLLTAKNSQLMHNFLCCMLYVDEYRIIIIIIGWLFLEFYFRIFAT